MIINGTNLAFLTQAYKSSFSKGFAGVATNWDKLATVVPSSTASNSYDWLGEAPALREWIGERNVKSLKQHKYSIDNKDFELTVAVARNAIHDDQYGVYSPLMEQIGYSTKLHPQELVMSVLVASATTLCYDGQYLCDTDHPVGINTTSNVSNHGGGAGAAWFLLDTSRPLKPFIFQQRQAYDFQSFNSATDEHVFKNKEFLFGVDGRCNVGVGFWQQIYMSKQTLDTTNFDAHVAAMMAYRSDQNKPLGISPNLLICGPSNRAAAKSLLEAQILASGASNTNFKAVDVIVTPYLT